jgi:hypothetical protein
MHQGGEAKKQIDTELAGAIGKAQQSGGQEGQGRS